MADLCFVWHHNTYDRGDNNDADLQDLLDKGYFIDLMTQAVLQGNRAICFVSLSKDVSDEENYPIPQSEDDDN